MSNESPMVTQPEVPTSAPVSPLEEKLLPQSQVNSIVGEAKQKGYERGYQQALKEAQTGSQQPSPAGITAGMNPDQIRQAVASEFANQQKMYGEQQMKAAQDAEGKRILGELKSKIDAAKPKYADFDDVTNQIDFREIPEILHYANQVDNAGDVLYDLSKNTAKIGTLRGLTPSLAVAEIRKLSQSIKQNELAKDQELPAPPLDTGRPSNVGTGKMPQTPAEWRKHYQGRTSQRR